MVTVHIPRTLNAAELATVDACFVCLGVSAAGMREADDRRQTYDLTRAAARALAAARHSVRDVPVSSGVHPDEATNASHVRRIRMFPSNDAFQRAGPLGIPQSRFSRNVSGAASAASVHASRADAHRRARTRAADYALRTG